MGIIDFINKEKEKRRSYQALIREQAPRVAEHEYRQAKEKLELKKIQDKTKEVKRELRSKRYTKLKAVGTSIKGNIQELKKARAEYEKSDRYKNNVWRNQANTNQASPFGSKPAPAKNKKTKKRKVIIEYE